MPNADNRPVGVRQFREATFELVKDGIDRFAFNERGLLSVRHFTVTSTVKSSARRERLRS